MPYPCRAHLDKSIFEGHFGKLLTDEVVLTDERMRHIKERHPEEYLRKILFGSVFYRNSSDGSELLPTLR